MLKYCIMITVCDNDVVRMFPCKKNTSAGVLNSYIDYLLAEGFRKEEIKDPLAILVSTDGETDVDIINRLDKCLDLIKKFNQDGIFLSIDPLEPDELYYVSDDNAEIFIDDIECVLALLKGALDTFIDIKVIGGDLKISNNKIEVSYDKNDLFSKKIYERLEPSIKSRHDVIFSMEMFKKKARKKIPKKFIYS